jgi:hypothetical protein
MKRILFAIATLCCLFMFANCDSDTTLQGSSSEVASVLYAEESDTSDSNSELDAILKKKMEEVYASEKNNVIGISAAVLIHGEPINGKEVWVYSQGENKSRKWNLWPTKLTPQKRMAPGSQTKTYVSALVLLCHLFDFSFQNAAFCPYGTYTYKTV